MSDTQPLKIDIDENFPHLEQPPLVEAVIHWQAHANKLPEPQSLKEELTRRLPDYPSIQTQHNFQVKVEPPEGVYENSGVSQQTQWNGFRLENESKSRVVQFMVTGVAISSIGNYESWETFHQEALHLWEIFQELAKPVDINRLGVRYINKISLEAGEDPSTYLKAVPHDTVDLPLVRKSFFYQDTYKVPNYPYGVNWICTQQEQLNEKFLIFDIDVFIQELIDLKPSILADHLNKIRWLKNKIFFNSITERALKKFGG